MEEFVSLDDIYDHFLANQEEDLASHVEESDEIFLEEVAENDIVTYVMIPEFTESIDALNSINATCSLILFVLIVLVIRQFLVGAFRRCFD